jgi:hypothetical protein
MLGATARKAWISTLRKETTGPELLEVVAALNALRGLAHRLDGGQYEAHEHGNDGAHHEQFEQRETGSARQSGDNDGLLELTARAAAASRKR